MTRRSWHLRARFCKNVWKNPEKLRLIFDGKQFFEPLGGQMGLKIGMYLQFNPIPGGVLDVRSPGGGGKFTSPCYLLKYFSKLNQTWQSGSKFDEEQSYI